MVVRLSAYQSSATTINSSAPSCRGRLLATASRKEMTRGHPRHRRNRRMNFEVGLVGQQPLLVDSQELPKRAWFYKPGHWQQDRISEWDRTDRCCKQAELGQKPNPSMWQRACLLPHLTRWRVIYPAENLEHHLAPSSLKRSSTSGLHHL